MIVFVWGTPEDRSSRGYLAMRRLASGDWVPVTGQLDGTMHVAAATCVSAARQEIAELKRRFLDQLARIDENLARLFDGPAQVDRLRILGQPCYVGQDGHVSLPEMAKPTTARPELDIQLDEELYQALRRATRQDTLGRPAAMRLVTDLAQNQGLELLLAVGAAAPDQVSALAELMVEIGQKLGVSTGFEPGLDDVPGPTSAPPDESPP